MPEDECREMGLEARIPRLGEFFVGHLALKLNKDSKLLLPMILHLRPPQHARVLQPRSRGRRAAALGGDGEATTGGGRMMRTFVIAGILLTISGCGDGTATSAPSRRSPAKTQSHGEIVATLNQVCDHGNRAVGRISQEAGDYIIDNKLQDAADSYRQALPIYDDSLHRLRSLRPPSSDRAALSRYIASTQRTRGLIVRVIEALDAGDMDQLDFVTSQIPKQRVQRLNAALDLGADRCGH